MSTYLDNLKRRNPTLYCARVLAGKGPGIPLRNMIRALTVTSALNTPEDDERLAAAKYVMRHRKEL